ncbi:MAG: T9SS type A sorting domain-containing protein, partial [Ginsengibacter sp.]
AGNFPTAITSGDLTILPNGRMFATLGSSPSRLYEIHNYSSTNLNATATFLTIIPQDCFGIAYLNGLLELAGTDFSGNCYYFEYDINTNLLSAAKTFQAGQLPVDNTSITPSLGVTKQLVSAVKVNANTADIVYEVYVTNLGNVALNNINVSDDLAAVFGAANVSNVNIAFVPGSNAGGLLLNNFYDGKTSKNMLVAGQTLKNNTSSNTDYFFKIRLSCRVTNLNSGTSYLNSAVGNATIGGGGNSALVSILDSSNDGAQTAADPNLNGNASEMGENVPTPFNFATLPVKFTSINADWIDRSSAKICWSVATPTINSDIFEIEFSENGTSWEKAGVINISDANKGNYEFVHRNVKPAILYYRIIETDLDGKFTYSNIVVLQPANRLTATVYPSPANEQIFISIPGPGHGNVKVQLFDAMAKQVILQNTTETSTIISTKHLPQGAYILKLTGAGIRLSRKILLVH